MHNDLEPAREDFKLTGVDIALGQKLQKSGLIQQFGERYEHHGSLRHFLPMESFAIKGAVLWTPGCATITEQSLCSKALRQVDGIPDRAGFIGQLLASGDHSMTNSYIPACWAVLKRYQWAQANHGAALTREEGEQLDNALLSINRQLQANARKLAQLDPYARRYATQRALLQQEAEKVRTTQERLQASRRALLTMNDVYGAYATKPDVLTQSLARWQTHEATYEAQEKARLAAEWEAYHREQEAEARHRQRVLDSGGRYLPREIKKPA